ncbi:hypothetical protein, partial [Klebsiella pneumoniae]
LMATARVKRSLNHDRILAASVAKKAAIAGILSAPVIPVIMGSKNTGIAIFDYLREKYGTVPATGVTPVNNISAKV